MSAKKPRGKHRGARPGLGRPRIFEEPVRCTVTYERADFDALEEIAEQREVSVSAIIRSAVRTYLKRSARGTRTTTRPAA